MTKIIKKLIAKELYPNHSKLQFFDVVFEFRDRTLIRRALASETPVTNLAFLKWFEYKYDIITIILVSWQYLFYASK